MPRQPFARRGFAHADVIQGDAAALTGEGVGQTPITPHVAVDADE